jgi:hypothetical protein
MLGTSTADRSKTLLIDLQSALAHLRTAPFGQRVLSAYLDTSPRRVVRQAYLLAFRDGCKALRANLPQDESALFEAAATHIERYLTEEFQQHQHGLALFAAENESLVAVGLPEAPLEDVAWSERPEIGPLEQLLDDYERIAVVLFDKERTRLFTVFLGAIESQQSFADDVPGKQATGGWLGLQQARFARHHEDHVRRHAERTVRTLMEVLRTRTFDRLLLAGPDEALAVLRRELTRPLRARLAGVLDLELFADEAEVLSATLTAAEAIEREHELQIVDELFEAASTPRVILGVAGTLGALADGRVHLLILTEGFTAPGGFCPTCNRLVVDAHRCPTCGVATTPVENLRESVIQQARQQGARLETVSGPAAERLSKAEGIGAWTRF